jgi:hypothetical protein
MPARKDLMNSGEVVMHEVERGANGFIEAGAFESGQNGSSIDGWRARNLFTGSVLKRVSSTNLRCGPGEAAHP